VERKGSLGIWVIGSVPILFLYAHAVQQPAMPPTGNKTTVAAKRWNAVFQIGRARCLSCHQGANASAGLDLSKPAGWTKLIVAGQPEKSILMHRILGSDGKPRMPMGFAPLTAADTGAIKEWIAGGAQIAELPEKHWAYQAIRRPSVPKIPGVTNPIDAFVRTRQLAKGLKPNPPADGLTLRRRLYFDILGLPPTLAELNAPIKLDALLDRPEYGERQAQFWLDLARYADSDGYEKDLNRPGVWRYRDWVINAFNRNMPFDQFTTEQLAGDLLPKPTNDQLVATGFNRNTMFNTEGGVDPAESMYQTIVDRVNTTSTVWLGSSMACARCHDHKYDPFTQRDYFRMYAVFNRPQYRRNGDIKVGGETWIEPELKLDPKGPPTLVMAENTQRALRAPIYHRGEFLSPRESVPSGIPHFLPSAKDTVINRLTLSKWITDPRNPLTARVQVNRMWAQVFGRGLVVTQEDFGTQGTPPTNPTLLDWLASELIDSHWDLKHIWRLIYSSDTYRQSSEVSAAKYQQDPMNDYLARGPRFRLDAEAIRDQALRAAGLLNAQIGGPSVMPYQPEGLWQTPYNGESWDVSKGADRYRRGIYTFLKRSAPYPSFTTFDAGSRETCLVRRSRTNTPLQSLALLNDPVYTEAGKALAQRMAQEATPEAGIRMGFNLCTSRPPTTAETIRLEKLFRSFNQPETGFQTVAMVLLNLDETLTKP